MDGQRCIIYKVSVFGQTKFKRENVSNSIKIFYYRTDKLKTKFLLDRNEKYKAFTIDQTHILTIATDTKTKQIFVHPDYINRMQHILARKRPLPSHLSPNQVQAGRCPISTSVSFPYVLWARPHQPCNTTTLAQNLQLKHIAAERPLRFDISLAYVLHLRLLFWIFTSLSYTKLSFSTSLIRNAYKIDLGENSDAFC